MAEQFGGAIGDEQMSSARIRQQGKDLCLLMSSARVSR